MVQEFSQLEAESQPGMLIYDSQDAEMDAGTAVGSTSGGSFSTTAPNCAEFPRASEGSKEYTNTEFFELSPR